MALIFLISRIFRIISAGPRSAENKLVILVKLAQQPDSRLE